MAKDWSKHPLYERELFGRRVEEFRKALGWSYARMAEAIGHKRSYGGLLQRVVQRPKETRLEDDSRRKLVEVLCTEAKTRGIPLPCDIDACKLHGVPGRCQFLELAGFVVPTTVIGQGTRRPVGEVGGFEQGRSGQASPMVPEWQILERLGDDLRFSHHHERADTAYKRAEELAPPDGSIRAILRAKQVYLRHLLNDAIDGECGTLAATKEIFNDVLKVGSLRPQYVISDDDIRSLDDAGKLPGFAWTTRVCGDLWIDKSRLYSAKTASTALEQMAVALGDSSLKADALTLRGRANAELAMGVPLVEAGKLPRRLVRSRRLLEEAAEDHRKAHECRPPDDWLELAHDWRLEGTARRLLGQSRLAEQAEQEAQRIYGDNKAIANLYVHYGRPAMAEAERIDDEHARRAREELYRAADLAYEIRSPRLLSQALGSLAQLDFAFDVRPDRHHEAIRFCIASLVVWPFSFDTWEFGVNARRLIDAGDAPIQDLESHVTDNLNSFPLCLVADMPNLRPNHLADHPDQLAAHLAKVGKYLRKLAVIETLPPFS